MFRQAGSLTATSTLPGWSLLFAREPEPDLDLDEPLEDSADETSDMDPEGTDPDGGGKKKLIVFVVLSVLAGGGVYYAMDSGMLAGLVGPDSSSGPAIPPSEPEKITPSPQAAKPPAPPEPTDPLASAPMPTPSPSAPPPAATKPPVTAPPTSPAPPGISTTGPTTMASAPVQPATSRPGGSARPDPLFREGQHVVILADPAKPTGGIPLMADAEGNRPGPTVPPDTEVTVLDGEMRNNAWFYTVRTPQGATGWISENRLRGARP